MFELDVTREFSAAHSLRGYNGTCKDLHGHNWTIQVFVQSAELNEIGIAVDFRVLKKELDALLADLDHKYLNELPMFREINPTSENIAQYIFRRLAAVVNDGHARVSKVRVCENHSSGATYFE